MYSKKQKTISPVENCGHLFRFRFLKIKHIHVALTTMKNITVVWKLNTLGPLPHKCIHENTKMHMTTSVKYNPRPCVFY